MQSTIVLAIMVLASIFTGAEYLRNNSTEGNAYKQFRAENIAANVLQYNDQMIQYSLANYDSLHLLSTINPGNVEQINLPDYIQNNLANYTLKGYTAFLDYSSVVFNYAKAANGESAPYPVLYLATSWESYASNIHGYKNIGMDEVAGNLAQDLTEHLYQGNSTFWVVPWVFKQSNCNIIDVYSQLPSDSSGASTLSKLQSLFNLLCTQVEAGSSYKFSTYVFLEPVINNPDM